MEACVVVRNAKGLWEVGGVGVEVSEGVRGGERGGDGVGVGGGGFGHGWLEGDVGGFETFQAKIWW